MMALIRILLAGLFVFLVVTVAAFVYLEWWQAILVSLATFLMLIYGAKYLIRVALNRISIVGVDILRMKSQVLRGATVDVHSMNRVDPPADAIARAADREDPQDVPYNPADFDWYEIEATIFPAAALVGPMSHWDLDDLRLVPFDTPDMKGAEDFDDPVDEVGFERIVLIENGAAVEPEQGKYAGPQRLRFTAAFPRHSLVWKFRYYFEQFGRIELPRPVGRRS